MTGGLGMGELAIIVLMVLVPLLAAFVVLRWILRTLGRRGASHEQLAALDERVARLEAKRGADRASP